MKEKIFILSCFFLLAVLTSSASAITIDMQESYQPGETAIFKIAGSILEPIFPEDVKFLRNGHVEVPFDYDIKRISEDYYLYFITPFLELGENESAVYALRIENVETTVNGQQQTIDFEQNFSVTGETAEYTIKPGFIISSDNFELQIDLNRDLSQQISVNFPEEREIILRPGKNNIKFDIEDISGGLYQVIAGSYTIPVYINKEIEELLPLIRFDPFEIDSRILIGNEARYYFSIRNTGEERIEDFSAAYDKDIIRIEPDFPDYFEPGEIYEFVLVAENGNSNINEIIKIEYGNESFEFPVRVEYTEDVEEVILPEGNGAIEVGYYCSELRGKQCSSGEICTGNLTISRDASNCCVGACAAGEQSSSFAWVGWVLGIILLGILGFVGLRYYKSKKEKDVFKEKITKAEKRTLPVI